jgi:hypothetical protein
VTFFDGATALGTSLLNNAAAVFSTASLGTGTHIIEAHYLGDSNNSPLLSSPVREVVTAQPGGGFVVSQNIVIGSATTTSLVAVDLNNDGYPDIVASLGNVYPAGNTIGVLLNQGNGTFGAPGGFLTGTSCAFVAVADFNVDGQLDLVTASSSGVMLSAGNGDGTFQNPTVILSAGDVGLLTVADWNGDGIPDLAAFHQPVGTADVLLGNGDGTFRSAPSISMPTGVYTSIGADFNGDGIADLAVASRAGEITILLGRGDGTFDSTGFFPSLAVTTMAAADLNGDGILDLAVAANGVVAILLGNGDGTFRELPALLTDPGTYLSPSSLFISDVNGDGIPDLLLHSSQQFFVFLGSGAGAFSGPYGYLLDAGAPTVGADFNRDGIEDFATIGQSGSLSIYEGALAPTLTLSATPNPVTFGGAVTLTVQSNFPDATGSVQILDSNTNVGSATLSGGIATVQITNPAAGTHYYQASYLGDSKYAPSATTQLTVAVQQPFDITFTASPNPAQVGQEITLTVTTPVSDTNAPVAFFDGTTLLSEQILSVDNVVFKTTLAAGSHQLRAYVPPFPGYASTNAFLIERVLSSPGGLFSAGPTSQLGAAPASLAALDFNLDGYMDITFANAAGNQVGTLLNNGNGTFSSVAWTPLTFAPGALVAGLFAEVYGVAVTDPVGNSVALLNYYNEGTFIENGPEVLVGTNPVAIATADFNGDGSGDLVTANAGSNDISVLLTVPLGNAFAPAVTLPAGSQPSAIATADFNNDGNADIVVAEQGGNDLRIFFGNGDGTFTSPSVIQLPSAPTALAVADFNGDGKSDIAVLGASANAFVILIGNGGGTFASPVMYNTGAGSTALAVADFNADGILDIAVSTASGVLTFNGTGNGSFQGPVTFSTITNASSLVAGDFGGIGRMDLAAAIPATDSISFAFNGSSASATTLSVLKSSAPLSRKIILTAMITPSSATGSVTFFDGVQIAGSAPVVSGVATTAVSTLAAGLHSFIARYTGGQGYSSSTSAPSLLEVKAVPSGSLSGPATQLISAQPTSLLPGDFNGDGIPDFAYVPYGGSSGVLLGNGDGTFRAVTSNVPNVSPSVAADFNGDGKLDIASELADVFVSLGNGDGTFTSSLESGANTGFITGLAAADVNRDGNVDLIAADSSGFADVSLGIGNGLFQATVAYPAGSNPAAVAVSDLNGDGIADIIVSNAPTDAPGTISVLMGDAAGGFDAPQVFPTGLTPAALIIADFNGDGHPDVAVAHPSQNSISILPGNGDGTFQPPVILALPGSPLKLFAADMNGDGNIDLVAYYTPSYPPTTPLIAFSVLYGAGNGSFEAPLNYWETRIPSDMAIADLNGDGRLDVVLTSTTPGEENFGVDVFLGAPPFQRRPCSTPPAASPSVAPVCPTFH